MIARYSYGVVPPKKVFNKAWKAAEIGSRGYQMLLRGSDCEAVEGTVFQDSCNVEQFYSREWVYRGLKQLAKRAFSNEDAGSVASSILYTLGIEWV